jgi:FixJ family two-component response regulator
MPPEPEAIVFVVDDDRVRDSLRWLLESIGLAVRTYATAAGSCASTSPATRFWCSTCACPE